tara:strand:- start:254 stop:442 length:189 start_codon:yes stop_codon:yes gene_type:complete
MRLAARPLVAQMVVVVMVAKQESAVASVAKMDVAGIQITAVSKDNIIFKLFILNGGCLYFFT